MSEVIVGIDLGTTNSEIAIIRDGQPYVLPDEDGDPILPSVVGLTEDGRLLVGKAARNQYSIAPDRTIKSIKRRMGEDIKVKLGDQELRPQEISAMILRALKDRASRELGYEVRKAVVTVPAYFNDGQRQATIEAGTLAGLEVVRILNEPTAASLVYDPGQDGGTRVLVYDLGGGTFDVSVVSNESGVVEVLASHGDTQLGGDDFDDVLTNSLAEKFAAENGIDPRKDRVSHARLQRAAENAKKKLSDHAFVRVEEEFLAEKDGVAIHLNVEVSREEYEALISPLIDRTLDCVQRTLDDAKLTAAQIDRVVLVGGSTRTPMVIRLLEERLGRAPHREINPDLCVAMGAAVQGAIIAGDKIGSVLVDITPHTLGIKAVGGSGMSFFGEPEFVFARILDRGTPLPASRSEAFSTMVDNQAEVRIEIYQGEDEDVSLNNRVGEFMVTGLARVKRGNQIVVQFDMTLDGVLKVTAREKASGLQKQVTIESNSNTYATRDREAARTRLNDIWNRSFDAPLSEQRGTEPDIDYDGIPEQTDDPMVPNLEPGAMEGQRESIVALALIEKTERLLPKAAEEDRPELERLSARLRDAVAAQQWPVVAAMTAELSDVLFYIEG